MKIARREKCFNSVCYPSHLFRARIHHSNLCLICFFFFFFYLYFQSRAYFMKTDQFRTTISFVQQRLTTRVKQQLTLTEQHILYLMIGVGCNAISKVTKLFSIAFILICIYQTLHKFIRNIFILLSAVEPCELKGMCTEPLFI